MDPCEEYNDRNRLNTHTQHWTCSGCTYENWPKSRRCVVCDLPRPNSLPEPIQLPQSDDPSSSLINEQDRVRWRAGGGGCSGAGSQRRSPPTSKREAELQIQDFQRIELAAAAMSSKDEQQVDFKKLKQIKNRMRKTDWLFLNACIGK